VNPAFFQHSVQPDFLADHTFALDDNVNVLFPAQIVDVVASFLFGRRLVNDYSVAAGSLLELRDIFRQILDYFVLDSRQTLPHRLKLCLVISLNRRIFDRFLIGGKSGIPRNPPRPLKVEQVALLLPVFECLFVADFEWRRNVTGSGGFRRVAIGGRRRLIGTSLYFLYPVDLHDTPLGDISHRKLTLLHNNIFSRYKKKPPRPNGTTYWLFYLSKNGSVYKSCEL
jgi:hypothetical protein